MGVILFVVRVVAIGRQQRAAVGRTKSEIRERASNPSFCIDQGGVLGRSLTLCRLHHPYRSNG